MSVIGATVSRVVGSIGGPTTAAALVAGGIVAGALGGGFVANGGFGGQSASAAGQLAVYPCPETGPLLTFITAGQKVLATGRNADSTWLRIHYPAPGRAEAWVEAGPMTVDGSVAGLPVAECIPELAIAPPSLQPEEPMTVVENNPPSAGPTPTATPSVTPTPTPTARPNTRPNVATLTASTSQISFDKGSYCPNAVKAVTFRVKATDAVGVSGVTLSWREPGAATFAETAMSRVSGTAKDGFWQATLNTAANGIDKAGSLAYFATARDAAGATRRIPATSSDAIQVKVCENTGPVLSGATSSAGSAMWWDPQGAGCSPTTTNITVKATDVDGVAGARLFFRRAGAGSFTSKPMNNTTIKGRWYANLDTLGDELQPGSVRWYIQATDTKGALTQSLTRSIKISDCDRTPPSIGGVTLSNKSITFSPCGPRSLDAWVDVTDSQSGVASVQIRIQNAATGGVTGAKQASNTPSGWLTTWTSSELGTIGTWRIQALATDKAGNSTGWRTTRGIFDTNGCIT